MVIVFANWTEFRALVALVPLDILLEISLLHLPFLANFTPGTHTPHTPAL
jgi:hypothetical protein